MISSFLFSLSHFLTFPPSVLCLSSSLSRFLAVFLCKSPSAFVLFSLSRRCLSMHVSFCLSLFTLYSSLCVCVCVLLYFSLAASPSDSLSLYFSLLTCLFCTFYTRAFSFSPFLSFVFLSPHPPFIQLPSLLLVPFSCRLAPLRCPLLHTLFTTVPRPLFLILSPSLSFSLLFNLSDTPSLILSL